MSVKVGDRVDLPHGIPVGATVKLLDANPFAVGRFEIVKLPVRELKAGDITSSLEELKSLPVESVVLNKHKLAYQKSCFDGWLTASGVNSDGHDSEVVIKHAPITVLYVGRD